jgi:maleate cis-trans isomerase
MEDVLILLVNKARVDYHSSIIYQKQITMEEHKAISELYTTRQALASAGKNLMPMHGCQTGSMATASTMI